MSVRDGSRASRRKARRTQWLARVGGLAFRVLGYTWRIRDVNRAAVEQVRASGTPVIFVLWHGDLLPAIWNHRREGVTALVSEHGDGEILARVIESLGFATARGSTTRGSERALLSVSRVARNGGDLAITPDGPRGPSHSFAPGALIVSQRSGAPIIPVAVHAERCWRLRSWDRLIVPKPFARVRVAYGPPTVVSADSSRAAAAQAPRFAALLDDAALLARG